MNKGLLAIYILTFIELLFVSNKHGQMRSDYDFWSTLIAQAIYLTLVLWALGWKFY